MTLARCTCIECFGGWLPVVGVVPSGKDADMSSKDADLVKIKELLKVMKENDLVEVEIRHDDDKIYLKRRQPQENSGGAIAAVPFIAGGAGAMPVASPAQGVSAAGAGEPKDEGLIDVKSPMVGTFYEGPSPDSEPYVEAGAHVDGQTVVCIIEAMKVMNEIKAETSGMIVEVLAKNGEAVEYGQALFRVRPD